MNKGPLLFTIYHCSWSTTMDFNGGKEGRGGGGGIGGGSKAPSCITCKCLTFKV